MSLVENTSAGFEGEVYRFNDAERADIREGLAEIERGEVAPKRSFEQLSNIYGSHEHRPERASTHVEK